MITYTKEEQKQNKKMVSNLTKKHRTKKQDTSIVKTDQNSMFDLDGYLYPKYRLQPVTWSFCWRCGKSIAINHSQEIMDGCHKECHTLYGLHYKENLNQVILRIG